MPTYVIVNRTRPDYTGSPEGMAAWNAWFDGLGAHLADRGNPVVRRAVLGDAATMTVLGGYSLVTADDLDAALALAASCPALADGGGVEVGELMLLNSGLRAGPA